MTIPLEPLRALTRRQTLRILGAAGAASLVRLGGGPRAFAAACAETASATEGPYWIDEGLGGYQLTDANGARS